MENPEEILHSLEEFAKLRPKDIPRELEEYLCFVAKTGDPVYQWSSVKSLFREKLINVITEFYESCPSVEIPPCPNVDVFNYEIMKNFILEKLDTFAAAPFTVQRICELLTTPRKEYNRIDKYMRALEKNILVVSTTEPGNRRSTENGESIMNGIDSENGYDTNNSSNDINVEEMDDVPSWPRLTQSENTTCEPLELNEPQTSQPEEIVQETFVSESTSNESACTSSVDTVITKASEPYVSIEPIESDNCTRQESVASDVSVTITAIPAAVQKRRDSIEPVVSSEQTEQVSESASSSIEKESTTVPEKQEQLKNLETTVESLVTIDSSITTSETEVNTVSCSEVSDDLSVTEAKLEEHTSAAEINSELESDDKQTESTSTCDDNFVIASTEEDTENNEISTSELSDNETFHPTEEIKESLISSSNEVDNGNTIAETEIKVEDITQTSKETDVLTNEQTESTVENTEETNIQKSDASIDKETVSASNITDMIMDVDVDIDEQSQNKTNISDM